MGRGTHPNSLNNLKKGKPFRADDERAREAQQKGTKSKRAKREAREIADYLAGCTAKIDKIDEFIEQFGASPEGNSNLQIAIIKSVIAPAMQGDIYALQKWLEILGQDGQTKRDILKYEHEKEMAAMTGEAQQEQGLPRIIRADNGELYTEGDE